MGTTNMLQFCYKHHWKVLNFLCMLALAWQLYGILAERIKPSNRATDISEKKLTEWDDFPVIFKICLDPAFNTTAIREGGYDSIFEYFTGENRYNSSILGWAGHDTTNTHTVESFYQNILTFTEANNFIEE